MTRVAFLASSIGELWLLIMLLDFFFSFPSSSSVLCRPSAYFLLMQEQWNLYFKGEGGGVCRAFNTPTDPEKSQAREMAKIIRLLSCLIIIIMIIIIIIIIIIILH